MRTSCASYRAPRPAFTLIEILVVITIILVLAAMTVVAVKGVGRTATVTQTSTEISQMSVAHAAARMELGNVDYLPSRIKLSETLNYPNRTIAGDIDQISYDFLSRAFGKKLFSPGNQVDWNGDGFISGDWILYADQTLVFWLGGIPGPNGATRGFSTNVINPAALGGTRKGPFYEFASARLALQANGFYQFADPWHPNAPNAVPFLYFSSYRAGNDYNPADLGAPTGALAEATKFGVGPYMNGATTVVVGGAIADVTNTADPTITTAAPHGLAGNPGVTITSVAGAYGVNGTWFVASVSPPNMFTITGPAPGAYNMPPIPPSGVVTLTASTFYMNQKGFQIISAGADGYFGPGGPWDPATGSRQGPGADDQANFSQTLLGGGQN